MAAATRARAWALTGENRLKNLLKPSKSHRGASRSPRGPDRASSSRPGPVRTHWSVRKSQHKRCQDRTRTRLLTVRVSLTLL